MTALSEWWHQVSGTVLHGLEITAAGMALVFFTLGLVIVAMVLLTKLPWLQAKTQAAKDEIRPVAVPAQAETEPIGEPAQAIAQPHPSGFTQTDELAQVAAIAVALLYSRRRVSQKGQAKGTRGSWRAYGRAHQLGL